jgi:SM-20-related protein
VLSLVLYLNPGWRAAVGGALRLERPAGAREVLPESGTLVAFLSDRVAHEVLPAARPRWSVAAWFRRRSP